MSFDFEKHIACGGFDDPLWGNDYTAIHGPTLDKVASDTHTPGSLMDVIAKLRPRPEGRYILLNALGAYEYYGSNRNGDAFPEWSLKGAAAPEKIRKLHEKTAEKRYPGMTMPILGSYGHETFVKCGHVYVAHANKDPQKSIGDIIASAYNDYMHRVELIVFVYEARAPELVKQIDNGDPIPWSMGSKLPFDLCSICLQASRSRSDYCDHLRSMLNTVLPDGRKVFSYNLFPKFFDISKVYSPADKSAWMLKKVASTASALPVKRYEMDLGKLSELEKRPKAESSEDLGEAPIKPELLSFLRSTADKDRSCSAELSDPQMDKAKAKGVGEALKALTALGVILKPVEVNKLAGEDPDLIPQELDLEHIDRTILTTLASNKIVAERSLYDPYFTKRAASLKGKEVKLLKTSANSKAYQRYRAMLKNLDMSKLASVIGSDPNVRLALNPNSLVDSMLGKRQDVEATMLPFAVGAAYC